jgi:hypothetical protein
MTVDHFWMLDSPSMRRDFLKKVRLGEVGAKITFLRQADGKEVSVDEASDEQVLQVANEIALALERKNET